MTPREREAFEAMREALRADLLPYLELVIRSIDPKTAFALRMKIDRARAALALADSLQADKAERGKA